MTNKTKLLPCPFCGNDELTAEPESTYVMCHGCDADGPMTKPGGATAAWNNRAAPAEDVRASVEEYKPVAVVTATEGTKTIVQAFEGARLNEGEKLYVRTGSHAGAVVDEPVSFKLKVCADGYGHGGHWCGAAYKCWLDPRDRKERDEDFERRKSAASQRQVAMPERLREIWLFLDGQSELNSCVFGEKPEGRHNFWWRKELRAVLEELFPQQ
jgi:hypothetical protein